MRFASLKKTIGRAFGYDAADDHGSGRRRDVSTVHRHEDEIATQRKRKLMTCSSRDLTRNFSVARNAINKHLDYVTAFSFQAKSGDKAFDATIERWMAGRSSRQRFDISMRHSLQRAGRIAEACRTLDGDVGLMRILPRRTSDRTFGKIQAVESDLIRTPPKVSNPSEWVNGVRIDKAGAAVSYGVYSRRGTGFEFQREVSAENLYLHGWYEDRFDQVRGVSPVVTALNGFRDIYEGFDFALAKLKVAQLFGLKIKRNAESGAWGNETPTEDADADGTNDTGYEVNLNRGPFQLDLEPGDDADFMEAGTPATETVEFLKLQIMVALKALDIPYSFFDEAHTNFYGSRGGLIQFLKSSGRKIIDNQDLLNWWTDWAVRLAILTGELELPRGLVADDIAWEWVPDGVPWWNPAQEARGEAMGIAMGATSPQRVCRERGTDFFENIDQIAEAMAYANEKGVPLTFADSSAFAPEITVGANNAA